MKLGSVSFFAGEIIAGKQRDNESGLDYFGARYLSSTMGRWMSPDWSAKADPVPYAKLDDPQTLNLYAYVGNNPLSGADRDGHYLNAASGGSAVRTAQDAMNLGLDPTDAMATWSAASAQQQSTPSNHGSSITSQIADRFNALVTSKTMYSAVNFIAGYSDTFTLGATAKINQSLGNDSEIDHSSNLYWGGAASGAAVGGYLYATGVASIASKVRVLGSTPGLAYANGRAFSIMYGTIHLIRLDVQEMYSEGGPVPHVHLFSDGGEHGIRFALWFNF